MQVESSLVKKTIISFLVIIVLGCILWYFSNIVIYVVVALFFSLLGHPIQAVLRKIRIHKWQPSNSLVATVTLVLIMGFFVGMFYLLTPVVLGQMANLSSVAGLQADDMISYPLNYLQSKLDSSFPNSGISFSAVVSDQIKPLFSLDTIKTMVGSFANIVINLSVGIFCVAFILFFFLEDEKLFKKCVMAFIPDEYEGNISRVFDSTTKLLSRYIVGITIESLVKFILLWISFCIIGLQVDISLVAAVICAVLNVIPYIGPIVGGVIAMFLGFVATPSGMSIYGIEISMLIVLVVFQLIDNILLQPYIYASSVKAHPLEIFIVIIAAGQIGGIVGMLVAIPAYTILRVIAKEFLSKYKVVRQLTTKL